MYLFKKRLIHALLRSTLVDRYEQALRTFSPQLYETSGKNSHYYVIYLIKCFPFLFIGKMETPV
jgi:hypothetical protein